MCVIFLMHVQMQITKPPLFMLLLLLKHRGCIFLCERTQINTNRWKALNLFINISQPDKVE